ncbi:IclR family transcriptional regulator [Actinomycetospora rhizophila]|uniref:IclR family transcriptional regulator n=1 Tax=Actinomycetospora rhizophila TaxID=1416876 RepID=A0ABV9ZC64_9PSEU
MTATDTLPPATSVLGRGVALLAAFRPHDDALGLAEIHRRTGIPKASAHRLLHQLVDHQLVDRDGDRYRLGLRLFELGALVPRQQGVADAVAPVLTRLHAATGLTVHLAVLDGTEVVYLHKIEAPAGPAVASRTGGRMPAHCTALGKALLAHTPDATAEVLAAGLRRRTPRTVVTPGRFLGQLAAARHLGHARDDEEARVGISCLAAPVLDARRRPLAAVSVTGRTPRMATASPAAAVHAAAADAARLLGTPPPHPGG